MEKLAVLLPILNEADNIDDLLQRLLNVLKPYSLHIVLIDDGSTDGTIDKVETFAKNNPENICLLKRVKEKPGCMRGDALVYGLRYAYQNFNPDIFIEMDGDLSHLPEEIGRGLELLKNGADVALGSKYLTDSIIKDRGAIRTFISSINSILLQILMDRAITDYSNGFRVYNRKAAEVIAKADIKYGSPIYLAEAIMLWKLEGLKIAEFPITYTGRQKGSSKVIVGDLMEGLRGAVGIANQYRRTKKQ